MIKKTLNLLFYTIILLSVDVIMHIFIKGENYSFIHIVLTDLFIGLFLSFIVNNCKDSIKKIVLSIINIIILLYILLVFIQIFIFVTYKNIFPLKTIYLNFINVIMFYHKDILEVIKNNILIFIFFILAIFSIFYLSKKIYINQKIDIKPIVLIVPFILFISSFLNVNKNIIGFGDNLKINGLKYAIINEFSYNNDSINIINENEENNESSENVDISTNSDLIVKINDEKAVYDEYNILDYDFDNLIKNEKREDYNLINKYIVNKKPTKKNEYTGLFEGKNLILICAEAFNSNIVDEKLFPTMYRLINNGFKLSDFYQPQSNSSTSAGEYAFLTGMIPVSNDYTFAQSINNDMGFTITSKLKSLGYNTYSFHNGYGKYYDRDETHGELLGFDKFYANEFGLKEICGKEFPDDSLLFDKTFDIISEKEPFLAYYMTYTAHMQYYGYKGRYHKELFDRVEEVYGDKYSNMVETYIVKNMFLEEGLKSLINKLEEKKLINDTVICMVPDHYPYGLQFSENNTSDNIDNLLSLYNDDEILNNTMRLDKTDIILWCGSLENKDKNMRIDINKPTSTIDLTPTLLNLFNIKFDSRLYPGRDIFSDEEGIVIYADGRYKAETETRSNTFLSKAPNDSYYEKYVWNAINFCRFNLRKDYYAYIENKEKEDKKYCYLTFEGGPTENTKYILNILNEKKVNASFLVTGDKDLDQLINIRNNGNTIGLLSYNSDYDSIYNDENTYINGMDILNNQVSFIIGTYPKFMRFYGGSYNVESSLFESLKIYIQGKDMAYLDWNVDSEDNENTTKEEIVNNVINGINNKNIVCIRFHDDIYNQNTIKALPEIIDILKEKGYNIKAWDQYSHTFHFK